MEFVDVESAKQSGRVNFGEMLSVFENRIHDCRIILVEKTDRLYRNFKDYVIIDELGIEVRLVKENSVVSNTSRASEKLMHGMKVLIAKHFIDNLREETSKGMTEKAEQGHWPSYAPIGYLNNRESRLIEIDPHKAPLIARLFELYASGSYSLKEMVHMAAELGLVNHRSGKHIGKSEMHRTLAESHLLWRVCLERKNIQGKHAPIVTRDLFDRVQAVFKQANRPAPASGPSSMRGLFPAVSADAQ